MSAADHAPSQAYLHATAVAIAEGAVLIRGASGAGKSQLALALMAEARRRGLFTGLIGDDRVAIQLAGGRLLARGHPALRGCIEERGTGILLENPEATGLIRCVVDLCESPERLPQEEQRQTLLQGVCLPRLMLWTGCHPQEGARRVLTFLKWP
jgi:serine kinase of HPr protein (carbohydrate metabolism regulator)